jgi:hypothetical protein
MHLHTNETIQGHADMSIDRVEVHGGGVTLKGWCAGCGDVSITFSTQELCTLLPAIAVARTITPGMDGTTDSND